MTTVKSNADIIANVIAEYKYDARRLNTNIIEDVYRSSELNTRNELNTASN